MSLTEFGLRDFRCFEAADIELGDVNIVTGANGAGKTSLLEGLFFLSRGRSFRTGKLDSVLRHGRDRLQAFGAAMVNGRVIRLGIERDHAGLRARYEAAPAESIAALAQALPLLVIEPHSHQLVEGGPAWRRRFMDWGAFHVEHDFLVRWRRYRRALTQRNALLKQGAPARLLEAWNEEFATAASGVDAARRAWLREFEEALPAMVAELLPDVRIGTRYRAGWAATTALPRALSRVADSDRERGVTSVGPHRADLALFWNGTPAQEWVSRGQQKMLAIALLLTQALVFGQQTGRSCLLLIDDPAAELDTERLGRLMGVLSHLDAQLVLTGARSELLRASFEGEAKRFHVEQGTVREVV